MWHEARRMEKRTRGVMVDMKKRVERRQEYYEQMLQDPMQLIRADGNRLKIHCNAKVCKAVDAPGIMLNWQGASDDEKNIIDRFDARSHLDFLPETGRSGIADNTASAVERDHEPDLTARDLASLNYERYRHLIHNAVLRIEENKWLRRVAAHPDSRSTAKAKAKRRVSQGVASATKSNRTEGCQIGFTYESTALPARTNGGKWDSVITANATPAAAIDRASPSSDDESSGDDNATHGTDANTLIVIGDAKQRLGKDFHDRINKAGAMFRVDDTSTSSLLREDMRQMRQRQELEAALVAGASSRGGVLTVGLANEIVAGVETGGRASRRRRRRVNKPSSHRHPHRFLRLMNENNARLRAEQFGSSSGRQDGDNSDNTVTSDDSSATTTDSSSSSAVDQPRAVNKFITTFGDDDRSDGNDRSAAEADRGCRRRQEQYNEQQQRVAVADSQPHVMVNAFADRIARLRSLTSKEADHDESFDADAKPTSRRNNASLASKISENVSNSSKRRKKDDCSDDGVSVVDAAGGAMSPSSSSSSSLTDPAEAGRSHMRQRYKAKRDWRSLASSVVAPPLDYGPQGADAGPTTASSTSATGAQAQCGATDKSVGMTMKDKIKRVMTAQIQRRFREDKASEESRRVSRARDEDKRRAELRQLTDKLRKARRRASSTSSSSSSSSSRSPSPVSSRPARASSGRPKTRYRSRSRRDRSSPRKHDRQRARRRRRSSSCSGSSRSGRRRRNRRQRRRSSSSLSSSPSSVASSRASSDFTRRKSRQRRSRRSATRKSVGDS